MTSFLRPLPRYRLVREDGPRGRVVLYLLQEKVPWKAQVEYGVKRYPLLHFGLLALPPLLLLTLTLQLLFPHPFWALIGGIVTLFTGAYSSLSCYFLLLLAKEGRRFSDLCATSYYRRIDPCYFTVREGRELSALLEGERLWSVWREQGVHWEGASAALDSRLKLLMQQWRGIEALREARNQADLELAHHRRQVLQASAHASDESLIEGRTGRRTSPRSAPSRALNVRKP